MSPALVEEPRRSVIQARSELFRIESDLNQSDEDTQMHIDQPKVEKNLMKRVEREGDFLTDVRMLGMARDEEKN